MDYVARLEAEVRNLKSAFLLFQTKREQKNYFSYAQRNQFNVRLKIKSVLTRIDNQLKSIGKDVSEINTVNPLR